jgi:hypothetical protein
MFAAFSVPVMMEAAGDLQKGRQINIFDSQEWQGVWFT